MSVHEFPALRVADTRFHLRAERGREANTLAEVFEETLLAQLASAIAPGAPTPSKEQLAELVAHSSAIAHQRLEACVCDCGHRFADHLSRLGCLECRCGAARRATPELVTAGETR
jgi:hypothetical protein